MAAADEVEQCENDATKVSYTLLTGDATCPVPLVSRARNERKLKLGSNKTLVGLGRGAALRGVTADLGGANDVIVRNVVIYDVNPALIEAGDAFSFDGASKVWLDHCESRSPLVDHPNARVHLFDNVMSDNPDYAVGAGCGAEVLLEANVFEAVQNPTFRTSCSDDSSLGLIRAPAGSNLYRADVGPHLGGDGREPNDPVFAPPYAYSVETAEDAWHRVLSRAGAGGPWALTLVRD